VVYFPLALSFFIAVHLFHPSPSSAEDDRYLSRRANVAFIPANSFRLWILIGCDLLKAASIAAIQEVNISLL